MVEEALEYDKEMNSSICVSNSLKGASNEDFKKTCGKFIDENEQSEVLKNNFIFFLNKN